MMTKAIKKKISCSKMIHKIVDYESECDEKWTSAKCFLKKIKCYKCQKLKRVNDCFEPDHKQQKNFKKQWKYFYFFVSFQQKNIRFPFNYKNDCKKKCFIHNNKNFDWFRSDYQFHFSAVNQRARKLQKWIKWTLNIDFKWTAFTDVLTAWFRNKHDN